MCQYIFLLKSRITDRYTLWVNCVIRHTLRVDCIDSYCSFWQYCKKECWLSEYRTQYTFALRASETSSFDTRPRFSMKFLVASKTLTTFSSAPDANLNLQHNKTKSLSIYLIYVFNLGRILRLWGESPKRGKREYIQNHSISGIQSLIYRPRWWKGSFQATFLSKSLVCYKSKCLD